MATNDLIINWILENESDGIPARREIAKAAKQLPRIRLILREANKSPSMPRENQIFLIVLHDDEMAPSLEFQERLKGMTLPPLESDRIAILSVTGKGGPFFNVELRILVEERLGLRSPKVPRPRDIDRIRGWISGEGEGVQGAPSPRCARTKGKECHCPPVSVLLRKLWTDHVFWTRLAIISLVGDLPDTKATMDRLMKNQERLGGAFMPFYGEDASATLTALLKAHIEAVASYLTAAKNSVSKDALAVLQKAMFDNADAIAVFLHKANPEHMDEKALQAQLHEHLEVTHKEIHFRLEGEWTEDVAQMDVVLTQILTFSEYLFTALQKQFPDRVK